MSYSSYFLIIFISYLVVGLGLYLFVFRHRFSVWRSLLLTIGFSLSIGLVYLISFPLLDNYLVYKQAKQPSVVTAHTPISVIEITPSEELLDYYTYLNKNEPFISSLFRPVAQGIEEHMFFQSYMGTPAEKEWEKIWITYEKELLEGRTSSLMICSYQEDEVYVTPCNLVSDSLYKEPTLVVEKVTNKELIHETHVAAQLHKQAQLHLPASINKPMEIIPNVTGYLIQRMVFNEEAPDFLFNKNWF